MSKVSRRLADCEETAAFLNTSTRKVQILAGAGEIPSIKLRREFRFDLAEVEAHLKAQARPR